MIIKGKSPGSFFFFFFFFSSLRILNFHKLEQNPFFLLSCLKTSQTFFSLRSQTFQNFPPRPFLGTFYPHSRTSTWLWAFSWLFGGGAEAFSFIFHSFLVVNSFSARKVGFLDFYLIFEFFISFCICMLLVFLVVWDCHFFLLLDMMVLIVVVGCWT